MNWAAEKAATLERLEAEGAPVSVMLQELSAIQDPNELWHIAEEVPALVPIMRAVYSRAAQLGAPEERARGYLAMAHFFSGDFETASALVEEGPTRNSDPVLLNVWGLLPEDPAESLERLREAGDRCPDARIYRSLAEVARKVGAIQDAREAIRWLMEHTQDVDELGLLEAVYAELR